MDIYFYGVNCFDYISIVVNKEGSMIKNYCKIINNMRD